MIRGATRGLLVFAATEGGAAAPAARWPDRGGACADLANLANAALTQRCVVTDTRPPGTVAGDGSGPESQGGSGRIALPFSIPGRAGAVAIEVADFKESESQPIVDLLEFGITWLGALMREEAANERLVEILAKPRRPKISQAKIKELEKIRKALEEEIKGK